MRAVITVIGQDRPGILARVSTECAQVNANVRDMTQSILKDVFTMIMVVDISELKGNFSDFVDQMKQVGEEMQVSIHVMHEDIFNSMHRI